MKWRRSVPRESFKRHRVRRRARDRARDQFGKLRSPGADHETPSSSSPSSSLGDGLPGSERSGDGDGTSAESRISRDRIDFECDFGIAALAIHHDEYYFPALVVVLTPGRDYPRSFGLGILTTPTETKRCRATRTVVRIVLSRCGRKSGSGHAISPTFPRYVSKLRNDVDWLKFV